MEAAEKEAKGLQDVPDAPVNRLGRGIPVRKQLTRPGLIFFLDEVLTWKIFC